MICEDFILHKSMEERNGKQSNAESTAEEER